MIKFLANPKAYSKGHTHLLMLFLVVLTSIAPLFAKEVKPQSNPTYWPPRLNQYYPDMDLYNQDGKKFRLSSLRGKVIIIEPVGMSCPACQAYSGANKPGIKSYAGVRPQSGLADIDTLLKTYAGISPDDPRIVIVQLLLFNMNMQTPSVEEASDWAKTFKLLSSKNKYILVGKKNMLSKYSYEMVPGFQLIDKNYVLRSDSTGHRPKNNLYQHLLPMVKQLL